MPLRNKITPALVERQSQRQNQQDGVRAQMHREGELEDHTYRRHSRSYQTSKALPTNAASSQMIWREKRDSPRRSREKELMNDYTSPPIRAPISPTEQVRSLERNLAISDFPSPPRIPTMDDVMQELVDVSIQYTNCADPVESKAPRQRVLQTNAEGIMEETAARIIAAATTALAPFIPTAPLTAQSDTILLPGPDMPAITPKRRGRPPASKRQSPKPRTLPRASSRKRNLTAGQPSPRGTPKTTNKKQQTVMEGTLASTSNPRLASNTDPNGVNPSSNFHTREPPLP